jgi:hypothetical protein
MESVKLYDVNGKEYSYKSLNRACFENGAKSGMNRENAIRFLASKGFEMSKATFSKSSESFENRVIAYLIRESTTLDKTLIENLEKQLESAINNLSSSSGVETILDIKTKLESARKPKTDIENIIAVVRKMFENHNIENTTSEENE